MKQTYKLLKGSLPIILVGAILSTVMGVIAFVMGYNAETSWLYLRGACTIIFAVLGFATMCYSGFVAFKANNVNIKRIRKNYGFLRFGSYLAFGVTLFIFGLDLLKVILATYENVYSNNFTIWRVLRLVFLLPASCHFLIMALPSRYKRKRLEIPKPILYVTSSSTVLWAIFSLLTMYFTKQFSMMNILKIWQIVIYLVFAVFFLFEVKFEHVNQNVKGLIFTGSLSFIFTMAFSLTTLICLALRIIPSNMSVSAPELFCPLGIGIYAFSRVCGVVNTMKYVINTSGSSTEKHHSHSHHGHHGHHGHHSHHSQHSSSNSSDSTNN